MHTWNDLANASLDTRLISKVGNVFSRFPYNYTCILRTNERT